MKYVDMWFHPLNGKTGLFVGFPHGERGRSLIPDPDGSEQKLQRDVATDAAKKSRKEGRSCFRVVLISEKLPNILS